MSNSQWKEIQKKAKLISLPDVYLRLKKILDDPDFTMAEVAVAISMDPAITLHLLRIVNSSLYGFTTKIETVSRAITLLGTQQVHDLILATSVAETFKGMSSDIMDMKKFWRRSVYCAVASRQLASLFDGCDKERMFVAGLLHDIGHLFMYQALPDLSQKVLIRAQKNKTPLYLVERDFFGFDYAWAGSKFMKEWSIPVSLCEMTKCHVEPENAKIFQLESILIHLGSLLTRADDDESVFNEDSLTVNPVAWDISNISPEDCLALTGKIEKETLELLDLFFPQKHIV